MVHTIRSYDRDAEIVVVVGYKADDVRRELDGMNAKYVFNPFFKVTNSIAFLWFARAYLERENVTVVHVDVVFSNELVKEYLTNPTDHPYVLVDSSFVRPGSYNAVTRDNQVLVMSNKLEHFDAKYCWMVKLDPVSSRLLKQEVDDMVNTAMHDQYFEDALVQMIMFHDFQLSCVDIAGQHWAEVDTVDDLLLAQRIHLACANNQIT